MNPCIVIPVYYRSPRKTSSPSLLGTYDHSTSLREPGELGRLLESLRVVKGLGQIILLVASDIDIEVQAAEKAQRISDEFVDLNIIVIGSPELMLIKQRFDQLGLPNLNREISLCGYAPIRNLGLVVAHILGFDSVVFLDDDEVVDDEAFLHKAMYGLGKLTPKGIPILVKSGFYYNAEGQFTSRQKDRWCNHFWQQARAFNTWISSAMKGPRLTRSNHVCGGCLAIHKEAFKRLAFDPWIVRGEDMDYMLNLRMYGSDIWFDNQWYLHHLPPKTHSEGLRFRQDIFRWMYEYRKMEFSRTQIDLMQVKPASLEPYPGPFLAPGIERRIKLTAWLRSLVSKDGRNYRKAARAVTGEASAYAQANCNKYFEFQFMWPELMNRVEKDTILQSALLQSAARRVSASESKEMLEALRGWQGIDPGSTSEVRLNIEE